jgi:hypothetical protein
VTDDRIAIEDCRFCGALRGYQHTVVCPALATSAPRHGKHQHVPRFLHRFLVYMGLALIIMASSILIALWVDIPGITKLAIFITLAALWAIVVIRGELRI